MVVSNHQQSGTTYRAQLVDVVRRATELEDRARVEYNMRAPEDPERGSWQRIERRYATIRGNAQHLLLIHDWQQQRKQRLFRLRRYLNLL